VPLYLYSSHPSSWVEFSFGKVSFHYSLFFWVDFSSRVFQHLSNGSLASRIFSTSRRKISSRNYQNINTWHNQQIIKHKDKLIEIRMEQQCCYMLVGKVNGTIVNDIITMLNDFQASYLIWMLFLKYNHIYSSIYLNLWMYKGRCIKEAIIFARKLNINLFYFILSNKTIIIIFCCKYRGEEIYASSKLAM
jgi:hypothetical protein